MLWGNIELLIHNECLSLPIKKKKITIITNKNLLRQTGSFEEQMMSKDKYPNEFSRKMEAIVFILQIFFAAQLLWQCYDEIDDQ